MRDRDGDPEETRHHPDGPDDDATRLGDEEERPGEEPTHLDDVTRTTGPSLEATPADLPASIGNYRILGKLGEGGMGVVYEAEQQHPKRRVALKVVRGGQFVDEQHVRMFQREADTLARLKHPDIAAIYESGRTEDGQHFFAMELVRGETLHAYLKTRDSALTGDELKHRLRMFRKACDAVHYAHQRGVIHRDLKPGNIIVTKPGADAAANALDASLPEVKILDFGLARITDTDVQATMVSEVGMIKGTLAYMSPEQARGNPEEIDVRTDVYALGVILYEMLTGLRPYDVQRASLLDAVRVICEQPAIPLRQQWSGARRLDPDLETIAGKALEKEADRRYGSAAALSEDIERYLTSQPILAHPPSTTYQLRKLVQRHKLPFAFAGTLVVLLIAFGIGMSVLFVRAVAAEERATVQAETANEALDFMTGMFEVSDPGEARGNTVTAREILDQGADHIRHRLRDQPEIQSRLMETMGLVYRNLGLYGDAEGLLEETVAIRTGYLGQEDRQVAAAKNSLAGVLIKARKEEEAEPLLLEVLEIQERRLDPYDPELARTLNNLGNVALRRRDFVESRGYFERALEIRERSLGPDHPEVAKMLGNLSLLYKALGDPDKALASVQRAVAIRRASLGDDHPDVATQLQNLAALQREAGRLDDALAAATEALAIKEKAYDPQHASIAKTLNTLGLIHAQEGDLTKARDVYERALVIDEAVRGKAGDHTLQVRQRLIDVLAGLGGGPRLAALIDDQLAALESRRGKEDRTTKAGRQALADTLTGLGREALARKLAGSSGESSR